MLNRVVHNGNFSLCHNHLHKYKSVPYYVSKMQCKSEADWSMFRGRSKSHNCAQGSGSAEIVQKPDYIQTETSIT